MMMIKPAAMISGTMPPLKIFSRFDAAKMVSMRMNGDIKAIANQSGRLLTFQMATLEISPPQRVRGTAIFLTADPNAAPTALMHNLKHNQVLHERIILVSIRTAPTPRVNDADRVTIEAVRDDIQIVTLSFGFMETPNVIRGLTLAREHGLAFDIMKTSFFLSRRALVPTEKSGMPRWQDLLFIFLARNSSSATEFFHIPTSRVVELGAQVAV